MAVKVSRSEFVKIVASAVASHADDADAGWALIVEKSGYTKSSAKQKAGEIRNGMKARYVENFKCSPEKAAEMARKVVPEFNRGSSGPRGKVTEELDSIFEDLCGGLSPEDLAALQSEDSEDSTESTETE